MRTRYCLIVEPRSINFTNSLIVSKIIRSLDFHTHYCGIEEHRTWSKQDVDRATQLLDTFEGIKYWVSEEPQKVS